MAQQYAVFPLSHPYIHGAMDNAVTGVPGLHRLNAHATLLPKLGVSVPDNKAASICCGSGAAERHLRLTAVLNECIGYDISSDAIAQAQQLAKDAGLTGLSYVQRDLDKHGLDQNEFDFIIAHQAVHHIEKLESIFENIYAALRIGGVFYLDEFVGPNRFQWTNIQLAEMNDWLASLPEKYTKTLDGTIKDAVQSATIHEMIAFDPSEAVRSEDIERRLRERFEHVETRDMGGTLTLKYLSHKRNQCIKLA